MKPRLTPHPHSENHHTIPTKVFLGPTVCANMTTEEARQQALHHLRRRILLAAETCPSNTPISVHTRALVWSWWRTFSNSFKRLTPLKKFYKLLGKSQATLHVGREDLQHLYEQSGLAELLQTWPQQHEKSLVPTTLIASALQAAEVATATLPSLPFGQESTDPVRRARRQRLFWDRLKTVCPRGTFYHGPLLQSNGTECKTAQEYDDAMLATRSFWFRPPVRYDPSWSRTLNTYRQQAQPWPSIPEPTADDYIAHLLLTKDSAPGPDGLPYALWRMLPYHTAAILQDDECRLQSKLVCGFQRQNKVPLLTFFVHLACQTPWVASKMARLLLFSFVLLVTASTQPKPCLIPFESLKRLCLKFNKCWKEPFLPLRSLQICPKLLNE